MPDVKALTYEWIRDSYKVNPVPGHRVKMENRFGTILPPLPGHEQYVHVRFDDTQQEGLCHPTWEMTYYGVSQPIDKPLIGGEK